MSTVVTPREIDTKIGAMGYLPVALFGSIMGLSSLTVAWRLAHAYFGTPQWVSEYIGYTAMLCFVAMIGGYAIKLWSSFDLVRAEFSHPVAGNMFGTPLISLLLLPILLADISLPLARIFWVLGTVGMTVFAWFIVNRWMSVRQHVQHTTPAWIIPVVGMINVPLAVPALHLQSMHGLMIFSLAIGLFFAVPLFTLIFSRLMVGDPMPTTLQPSLLFLVAPFAVGFSSYVTTVGHIDAFAESLFMLMLFLLAVLLGRLLSLAGCCPFRIAWWSVSFPLASSSSAAMRYATYAQNGYADGIALSLLALASVVIFGLLLRTLLGIVRGELRTLTGDLTAH
ncbi:SLAC1 anion channel family protein [Pseudomonas moorei]|uniref:SLAC1 anion channel family protein n=1 Tax=Pseudomonas moorei TaxID=395599 RepID=UPI0036F28A3F